MERLPIWVAKGLGVIATAAIIFSGFAVPLTTLTNEMTSDNWMGWLFLILGLSTLSALLGFLLELGR